MESRETLIQIDEVVSSKRREWEEASSVRVLEVQHLLKRPEDLRAAAAQGDLA